MRRHHRVLFYFLSGFIFITITLVILSDNKGMTSNNEKVLTKNDQGLELTKAETRALLRQVESTNNHRIERIEQACRQYNLGLYRTTRNKTVEHPPVPQYSVFYVDRENKLSFCPIYKAGSSTWLYNLCLLAGMTEQEIETSGKQISHLARYHYPELNPSDAEQALPRTIKLITVRHPFERLLSAYRDKLENTNFGQKHGTVHFYNAYGSKIVKKYRKNGNNTKTWELLNPGTYMWNPNHPKPAGIEPTFREFVLYLINLNLAHYSDDHWIPYYLFCTPCLLRYDIVAKVETLDLDQLFLINVLGLQNKLKPRWRHKTQFLQANQQPYDTVSLTSKIYFRQLSVEEIKKLYGKYKVDFDLFGYDHSEYLKLAFDYSPPPPPPPSS